MPSGQCPDCGAVCHLITPACDRSPFSYHKGAVSRNPNKNRGSTDILQGGPPVDTTLQSHLHGEHHEIVFQQYPASNRCCTYWIDQPRCIGWLRERNCTDRGS